MLMHGFPENWWEWHELIGPLAADGYRVLCPDLRGAGWSSAPRLFVLPPPERPLALPAPLGVGDTKPGDDDVGDKLDVAEGIQGESRILHRSQDRRDGNIATRNINRASKIRPMARCKKCPSELQLPGSAQCARARISWPAPAWPWPRWRRRRPASIPRARSLFGTSRARR
jgi:hypothetical protein